MMITASHVEYFLRMSQEIKRLEEAAPERLSGKSSDIDGPLTKAQSFPDSFALRYPDPAARASDGYNEAAR